MSNQALYFTPVFPLWLILLSVAVLFGFFIWKELRRKQKYPGLRLAAQFIVLIAILGIMLRPGFVSEKKSTGILILTPGYSQSIIDSLVSTQSDLRLIHTTGTEPYRKSQILASYFDLSALSSEIHFIAGEGLPEYALELIDPKKFQFIPGPAPTGITHVHMPENIKVNQPAVIEGTFISAIETTLILAGPGGKEDSVSVKANSTTTFSLTAKPKQAGKFIYTLTYQHSSGVITEQLPLEIKEEQKLTILLLQKFPDFEIRQVKNFLAEKGHKLVLRYQVSKNNYRFEYANTAPIRIAQLTPALLQTFDLIMTDNDALEALNTAEKNILETSIQNGLGIILFPGSEEKDKSRDRFTSMEMKRSLKDTVQLNLNKQYTLPVVPLQIVEKRSVFPVTKNSSRIFSGYTYVGQGKAGVQLLRETYRLALEGNIDGYTSLWSPLLEKVARSKNDKFKIKLRDNLPYYPDEPLNLEVIATTNEHPTLTDDQTILPMTEHVTIDNTWLGKTWAGQPGWHQLSADGSALNYYVSEPQSWKSLRVANQIQANKIASISSTETVQSKAIEQQNPIPVLIFYLMFLLASGFLWLAPKI
jgi:hypothetical protein